MIGNERMNIPGLRFFPMVQAQNSWADVDMFLRLPKSCGYLPQNRLETHVSVSQKKPRPYGENFESSLSSPDLSLEPLVILGSVGHSISFPKYPLFGNSSPSQSTVWSSLPSTQASVIRRRYGALASNWQGFTSWLWFWFVHISLGKWTLCFWDGVLPWELGIIASASRGFCETQMR